MGALTDETGAERRRLADIRQHHVPWWRWGPYLSERQWGTVREDYSPNGDAWESFPHDQARWTWRRPNRTLPHRKHGCG